MTILKKDEKIEFERVSEIVESFSQLKSILVLGDVGIDKYTYGNVSRISPEAPVPILEVSKEWTKLGLAANVIDNLSSLKVPSTLCSVIGDDSWGNQFESLLEDNHCKTWGIIREEGRRTIVKERIVTSTQQIVRVDYENKNPFTSETYDKVLNRIDEIAEDQSAAILEDYYKGFFNLEFSQEIIKKCKSKNLFLAVDPSRYSNPDCYLGCDLLKPNFAEAKEMVFKITKKQLDEPAEILKILANELEIPRVVVTLGEKGMGVLDSKNSDEVYLIPTVQSEVFDVSGAGDTAIATLVSSLQSGASMYEAGVIANCASGTVVAKRGTATVYASELLNYFQNQYSQLFK